MRETAVSIAGLPQAVATLDEKESLRLVRAALEAGDSSVSVLRAVEEGLRLVGERYEKEEIFLAGLIMAGEILRGTMELVGPGLEQEVEGHATGRVLLGTVAGDIHDIGKNAAALTLRSHGFTVRDLGVNVPPQRFLEEARTFAPDIVGLSGLLFGAFAAMQETVALFRAESDSLGKMPAIIIGGGTIDEHVARHIGADCWTTDAVEGVRLCQMLMDSRSES